jgi:hypothetical protein
MVAIDAARGNSKLPPAGRWYRGWHLLRHENVLVRWCRKEELPILAAQIELWRSLLVHGVARLVGASTEGQVGYLAIELPGAPLYREAKRAARIEENVRVRWALELCALLLGLSNSGHALPDARLDRFNVDPGGHLWLVDLWPFQKIEVTSAHAQNLEHARATCLELLNQAPYYTLAEDAQQRVREAKSLEALAAIFT